MATQSGKVVGERAQFSADLLTAPALQISLDYLRLEDPLSAAAAAVENGIDWLEVGTPLVMSEGLRSVELLRALYPRVPIVVDLKNMDGGAGVAERVADAGGTFVVVMALSSPRTVEAAVEVGHKRGLLTMVDIMGVKDKVQAGRRLGSLGADLLVAHRGVDERRGDGATTVDDAVALGRAVDSPVQAVGGLSLDDFSALAREGLKFAVVGAPLIAYDAESVGKVGGVVRAARMRFRA